MSAYPEKVWRLFREPRRSGRFDAEPGVVTGLATTPAGPARLQIQLRLSPDQRVEDAVFLALGCPWLIATGSWVCGHVLGRKLSALADIRSAFIAEQLELSAVKRYCAVMAVEALAEAAKSAATTHTETTDHGI